MYIGKAFHEGELWPAKILPHKRRAAITYGGNVHHLEEYDYICEPSNTIEWVPFNASVTNLVEVGRDSNNSVFYVGRCEHMGTLVPGRVNSIKTHLYIGWDGAEIIYETFEVLVRK